MAKKHVNGYRVQDRCAQLPQIEKYLLENAASLTRKRRYDGFVRTNEERLTYYRTHGLTDCSDYPGGDRQFEQDVLSGIEHMMQLSDGDLLREDAYVLACMKDGRFQYDADWIYFLIHPLLKLAFYDYSYQLGFSIMPMYPDAIGYPGGVLAYRRDVTSGEYVKRILSGADKDRPKNWRVQYGSL